MIPAIPSFHQGNKGQKLNRVFLSYLWAPYPTVARKGKYYKAKIGRLGEKCYILPVIRVLRPGFYVHHIRNDNKDRWGKSAGRRISLPDCFCTTDLELLT